MCNLYTQSRSVDEIRALFAEVQMPLAFPEGVPNLPPRDIAITDPGAIVRAAAGGDGSGVGGTGGGYELVVRRWSWPGPGGRPVYNFRADGRTFGSGRCLIVADGFYEYTTPADPRAKRKDRWLFSAADGGRIAIAGLVRAAPGMGADGGVGEAFTMLTTEPGPDVAPYHARQVAVLTPDAWRGWLDGGATELLRPRAMGVLKVEPANRVG